ncbi:RTA-like protein [Tricladium varicosporioides]|nr:RTA-like protein [Hymenoscyphus varicosporioides]
MVRSKYAYDPSLPAAIVVATLFTLAFFLTATQWIRYRSWVWLVMVLAAAMEGVGYIIRCFSIKSNTDKSLYVAQYSLVVLAPVLMAGACYVVFGRIVFHVVPKAHRTLKLLWISPRWLTPIFVVADIIALMLQLVGAVQITTINPTDRDALSKSNRAKRIAEIGVAVQLIFFGLFSVIAVRFNFTSKRFASEFEERITLVTVGGDVEGNNKKGEKYVKIDGGEKILKRNWQSILRVVNVASVCILIRSVYRMVEFAMGRTGYPAKHEWMVYVFDALVIFPVVVLFIHWHPGKYLPYLGFRLPKNAR